MTREDDDLYARHQMLAALTSVLVHDLRNPLHSATLLVEAMSSPSADLSALRGKLRAQFGKLEAVIAETTTSMRELALPPCIETVAVDALIQATVERFPVVIGLAATFVLPPASGFSIAGDRRLLERAALEIAAAIAEQHGPADPPSPPKVMVTVDEPEAGTVRLRLGDLGASHGEAIARAPFAIPGGGLRLAVARALSQRAGATLRLESGVDGARFALLLRKTA